MNIRCATQDIDLGTTTDVAVDPMRHARYNSIGLPSNQKIYNGYQIENEKLKDLAERIFEYMPLDRIFLKLYGIDDIVHIIFIASISMKKAWRDIRRYLMISSFSSLFQ